MQARSARLNVLRTRVGPLVPRRTPAAINATAASTRRPQALRIRKLSYQFRA
jgi:hypothetical protein